MRLIYIIIFSILLLTIPSTSLASDSNNNVGITVSPNSKTPLMIEVNGEQKPSVFTQGDFLNYPTAINNIIITDLTGEWGGWEFTLEATPLKNDSYEFPPGSLSIANLSSIISKGGQSEIPNVILNGQTVIDDGPVLIAKAGENSGMGSFEIVFSDSLSLSLSNKYPSNIESGVYYTTLKWQLKSASGEMMTLDSDEYELYVNSYSLTKDEINKEIQSNVGSESPSETFDESYKTDEDDGLELSKTSTNIFNSVLIGTVMLLLGILLYLIRRRLTSEKNN